jgi:hypothetical protein
MGTVVSEGRTPVLKLEDFETQSTKKKTSFIKLTCILFTNFLIHIHGYAAG